MDVRFEGGVSGGRRKGVQGVLVEAGGGGVGRAGSRATGWGLAKVV